LPSEIFFPPLLNARELAFLNLPTPSAELRFVLVSLLRVLFAFFFSPAQRWRKLRALSPLAPFAFEWKVGFLFELAFGGMLLPFLSVLNATYLIEISNL